MYGTVKFSLIVSDPWLLAMVAGGLLVVAAAASLWPSWRATSIEPLTALRAE